MEHLALNKGKMLEPKFLHDVQELYTDGEVRYIENGWAFANGMNWISNELSTVLRRLRIVSRSELDTAKSTEHRGIT